MLFEIRHMKHMEQANVNKWSVFDWYQRFRGVKRTWWLLIEAVVENTQILWR